MIEISALTRSVVKRNHALITPDGYVNSTVPGWANCKVNVIISEQMGARLSQTLVTLMGNGQLSGQTKRSQIFFYVLSGRCRGNVSNQGAHHLRTGEFLYIPVDKGYLIESLEEGTELL